MTDTFLGYRRPDGSVGIRNDVLVLPGGFLASQVASMVRGVRTLVSADSGTGHTARDRETIARTWIGLGANPNIAAVLVIGTRRGDGYPEMEPGHIADAIAETGKPVLLLETNALGGDVLALGEAVSAAREMVWQASRVRREPCSLGDLCLGVKCGGSDPISGLVGNPVVGHLFDRVVAAGGTAMFGETTEIIGAEYLLAKRAVNDEVAKQIIAAAHAVEDRALASGEDVRTINPVPANIAGGISTLEEKSLGAIHKSGTAPIQGVLQYGERPDAKGLWFCDNWQSAGSIFLGFAASGVQLNLFQMGGGGMVGTDTIRMANTGVAPLLWTTASRQAVEAGPFWYDFYSGDVIHNGETLESVGERLVHMVLDVASGSLTMAETLRYADPQQVYLLDAGF